MSAVPRTALAALIVAITAPPAAQAGPPPRGRTACAAHAPEASRRSGLPVEIVMRVMMAESAGNPRAISPKGAMGCMQIMPATWSYLSNRYALGADTFDARMNMIGGAMYLAELAARYGFPGAFAAYNAGPGRYQRYAAGRAALPAETIAYTARIGRVGPDTPMTAGLPPRWQDASLFLVRATPSGVAGPATATDTPTRGVSGVLFPLAGRGGVEIASSAGP